MAEFDFIYEGVVKELETGLPDWLHYHNVKHTKYVLQQAETIAEEEGINGRDLFLVKIAALYHDIGFLVHREDHEKLGCKIVREELKDSDLTTEEINKVCGMIMATQVPQQPQSILEKIVADADLEYLGTANFESFSKNLYKEILNIKPHLTKREWDEIQINFLSGHSYHTSYCKTHKEPVKQKNLQLVRERLLEHKR